MPLHVYMLSRMAPLRGSCDSPSQDGLSKNEVAERALLSQHPTQRSPWQLQRNPAHIYSSPARHAIGAKRLQKLIGRVCDEVITDDCVDLAAQMSYYFALSLFPFLMVSRRLSDGCRRPASGITSPSGSPTIAHGLAAHGVHDDPEPDAEFDRAFSPSGLRRRSGRRPRDS